MDTAKLTLSSTVLDSVAGFLKQASVWLLSVYVLGPGAARQGASMFPAVLQWRHDRPCWQKRGGGGGGEHSE